MNVITSFVLVILCHLEFSSFPQTEYFRMCSFMLEMLFRSRGLSEHIERLASLLRTRAALRLW